MRAILRYVLRKRPTRSSEHDPLGAGGAGDVLELLQLFYSFPSRNLVWKMITYSRDVPVGTLRTVRGRGRVGLRAELRLCVQEMKGSGHGEERCEERKD